MNQPEAASSTSLMDRLGWRAERRPEPGFAHALGAGAAAFAVFAVFALIIEVTSDDATLPGVGFYLVLGIVSFLVGAQISGPVRAAAVTAIVFSVPLIWFFAFLGDGEGGSTGDIRAIYLLTVASYAALYLFTWTRGRNVLLGLALLLFVSWLVFEVGNRDSGPLPFSDQISSQTGDAFGSSDGFRQDDKTTETSTVALVVGLAYLGTAAALDRKKLVGAATPFVLVGTIATLVGAVVLGGDESLFWGGFAAVAAGTAVGLVGGFGTDRRFSTWFGVVFVVGGLLAIVVDFVSGDQLRGGRALEYAGVFALAALLMGAAAWCAAPRLREHVDGDVNAPKTG